MKKFEGTPGTWLMKHSESKTAWNVIGTELSCKYKIARCPYINDADFCDDLNKKEEREAKANARLIAASPEMLNVLIRIAEARRIGNDLALSEIETVIDKALGINNYSTMK